jgi:hypothetical protein
MTLSSGSPSMILIVVMSRDMGLFLLASFRGCGGMVFLRCSASWPMQAF